MLNKQNIRLTMNEKLMQDLLKNYPTELIEDGLSYLNREISTGNRRLDLVFQDRFGRLLLVEAQLGSLDTKHIDRHIDFVEGYLENNPDVDLRLMYIANRIDPLRKSFLEKRGYEYLEISQAKFIDLTNKYKLFDKNEPAMENPVTTSPTINILKQPEKPSKKFYTFGDLNEGSKKLVTEFFDLVKKLDKGILIEKKSNKSYPLYYSIKKRKVIVFLEPKKNKVGFSTFRTANRIDRIDVTDKVSFDKAVEYFKNRLINYM